MSTVTGGNRPPRHAAPVPDLAGGPTHVTVTVARPGVRPVTATYSWVVGPATPPPTAVVSRAPLTPAVRLLAVTLASVAAGLGLVVARRRTRRPMTPDGRASTPDKEPALP